MRILSLDTDVTDYTDEKTIFALGDGISDFLSTSGELKLNAEKLRKNSLFGVLFGDIVVEVALNKDNRGSFVAASGCQVAERTD